MRVEEREAQEDRRLLYQGPHGSVMVEWALSLSFSVPSHHASEASSDTEINWKGSKVQDKKLSVFVLNFSFSVLI